MISASKLLEFLATNRDFKHDRYEMVSVGFGQFRRHIGKVITRLGQSEDFDASEIVNPMRVLLFSWLTAPVKFDSTIRDAVSSFGNPDAFEARWGTQGDFKAAIGFGEQMILEGNPLREKLRVVLEQLHAQSDSFKIFCHTKSRTHYETLDLPWLNNASFLHTVRDYANAEPFETLVKIGPLRSKGWGAAPDAIKSAPKYERLVQLVWTGCADDPRFGYDPVEAPVLDDGGRRTQSNDVLTNQVVWISEPQREIEPVDKAVPKIESDEFSWFSEPTQQGMRRRATLVEISAADGILYPPTANILSFDPAGSDAECVDLRIPGASLSEGMFVVQTQLGDIDFGATQAQEGGLARIWKERLRQELKSSADAFCHILRNKGVSLLNLRNCVTHWAQPSRSVIHAPQQKKHFQILIEALAIDAAVTKAKGFETRAWWQSAWDEIRVTRGEAIQTGRQGHEIVEQQTMELLKSMLPQVRSKATNSDGFRVQIPYTHELRGEFAFFKVIRIEDGFVAPESEIRFVRDLVNLEQWRVA